MSVEVLTPPRARDSAVVIRLTPAIEMTDDEYFALCQINRELMIERTAEGDLIVMPPTGFITGDRNSEINMQLRLWAKRDGTGVALDSSTGFRLPNGATRAPDAAWILRSRLVGLTIEQKQKFLPLCPDFVIELRSPNDALENLQTKMDEYIMNGARLGFLIDPPTRRVFVYRPNAETQILENPSEVSGSDVLQGFVLDLREIWETDV